MYPSKIFKRYISSCWFRRWHALHTFMEAFQGQYKDGTNGTRDFRMVSALYLIFRIAALLQYFGNQISYDTLVWLTTAVVLTSTSLFFSNVRPYKRDHSNTVDSLLLALLNIQAFSNTLIWQVLVLLCYWRQKPINCVCTSIYLCTHNGIWKLWSSPLPHYIWNNTLMEWDYCSSNLCVYRSYVQCHQFAKHTLPVSSITKLCISATIHFNHLQFTWKKPIWSGHIVLGTQTMPWKMYKLTLITKVPTLQLQLYKHPLFQFLRRDILKKWATVILYLRRKFCWVYSNLVF